MTEQKHTPVSSDHIAEQIDAIAVTLSRLEREAVKLSLAAVSGDEKAAQRLADINADIERAKADRVVFQRAEKAALQIESAEDDRIEEEKRRQHYLNAARTAVELIGLSEQLDAAIEKFAQTILDMRAAERAISSELVLARKETIPGFWQFKSESLAFGRINNIFEKGQMTIPPVSERTRAAWGRLASDAQPEGDE